MDTLRKTQRTEEGDVKLMQEAWGALNFILAFYEPGQHHLDTEAWKHAEAGGRRVHAKLRERLDALSAPQPDHVSRKWKRGDITVRDGKVLRFIEEEVEGEKWEIVGAAPQPVTDPVVEIVAWLDERQEYHTCEASSHSATKEPTLAQHHEELAAAAALFRTEISRRFGSGNGGWLPIESAPKDGTPVLLLFSDGLMEVGKNSENDTGWWSNDNLDFNYGMDEPTHWRPLPPGATP